MYLRSLRGALLVGVLALLASGCTTGLGPHAIRADRPDYNQQITRSMDSELLLNVVRLRYDDTPLFLELGAVVSQYGVNAAINGTGHVDGLTGSGDASFGGSVGYSENPTITYTPLTGEDFAERMLSPIPLDAVLLFVQTGWSAERLFLLAIQRVNDLYNAPSATGPTPEAKPDYEDFEDFVVRFERLRAARLAGLNWEKQENEKQAPGRDPHFWIHAPADPASPLAADVEAVRRYLGLAPGGAYNYVINGRMIAGFAMVAYPAEYGKSGVMTFIVSHNGKVYERDLGKNSTAIGSKMSTFDPGAGWKEVAP